MIWDIHNQRVIASVGMGWDIGAPLWPYQTPDTLFFALNVPAYLIALPFNRLFHMYVPWHYLFLFPSTLLWWWFVGRTFDGGSKRPRSRRLSFCLFILAIALIVFGEWGIEGTFRWWFEYCGEVFSVRNLITLRSAAPYLWCFVLSIGAAILGRRMWFYEIARITEPVPRDS
jgi:hypothetical protein